MSSSSQVLGTVVSLWRYPVKSMMGEELNAARVTRHGTVGDRAYAVVEPATLRVGSAKVPRKWSGLFEFRAAFVEPPIDGQALPRVRITFPDGSLVTSDDPEIDALLSKALGRAVELTSSFPGGLKLEYYPLGKDPTQEDLEVLEYAFRHPSFFDAAPIHLLTTATLDHLRALYPQGQFEVRRFRPNIVVRPEGALDGFVEDGWVGKTLAIGGELRIEVRMACPRCVMPTLPQGDLPHDPGLLRVIAKHNEANAGVYATVVREGTVRRGDSVHFDE